ncbi:MAG TPA: hypothetical protein VME40_10405 [Caulobacteraceae bacterium]|nr:hypothetical protein [Caulobacteraceae bacterium]
MLFLLNDQVLKLERAKLPPPMEAARFRRLTFDFIRDLGRELFAEQPLLARFAPGRAERLAALIAAKAPRINAAQFVAPGYGCPPAMVAARFAEISFENMIWLYQHQQAGLLTKVVADRQVWRRLAA